MGAKDRGPLTEPMFYILLALWDRELCGTEIREWAARKTRDRVCLGPGTLYTLLGKFLEEKYLEEAEVEGRKRTYRLTERGRAAFQEELDRLRACVADGEEALS
ncbi:MAG: PadR family transcriptional regulator [Lawsonibacter sp.]|nr:PadR family transcriptional regulator [Lawsonibacter sp.]